MILPRGAQRGTDVELTFYGERLADARSLLFDHHHVQILEIKPVDESRFTAKVHLDEACVSGALGVRVLTKTGLSNLRTFHVGVLPEVSEVEPNDTVADAQVVELNHTVNGTAGNEDLDVYTFEAKKGDRVTAQIDGMSIGDQLFDTYIAILDARGFALATCDDAALLRQDAFVSITVPEDGRYFVHARESSYAGNNNFRYRLHLGTFPRPTLAVPLGGKPGEKVELSFVGGGMTGERQEIMLPSLLSAADIPGGWRNPGVFALTIQNDRGVSPSPIYLRVNELDNVLESEPNNNHRTATEFTGPAALNGIIDVQGDQDCYKFAAAKGERYLIAAFARQLRSPLDAVLRIHRAGARQIAANDDTSGPDPFLDFTAPEDGEYIVTIHDHLRNGGDDYAYRIELWRDVSVAWAQLRRNSEDIVVPRGNRMATIVNALRVNLGGAVQFAFDDLPEGVSSAFPPMPGNVSSIPVVLEATTEAPIGASLSRMTGEDLGDHPTLSSLYQQDIELVLGQNNTIFMAHSVDQVPIAVVEEAPFSIMAVQPKAPLVQSGSMELIVRATRREGFDGPIRLRVPFVPPGVGASNSINVGKGETEARVPFNANGNAAVGDWPIVVTAESGNGRGPVRVSSQLVSLTVAPPFLAFRPQTASVEQGQTTTMPIEVQRLREFAGNAEIRLHALPNEVTAEPILLEAEMDTIQFALSTTVKSPPGRHRGVFCTATVMVSGEPVVHRLGAGELRIDTPLTKEVQKAAPPPPPAVDESKPAEKPLSRLEKLRREYEARKKAEKEDTDNSDIDEGASKESQDG